MANSLSNSISAKCPYADGDAVYAARSLYNIINHTAFFDDEEICNTVATFKKEQVKKISAKDFSVNVAPNPANTELTLSYALEGNTALQISIADASGKTVYEITAQGSSIQQAINTASWPNGIYMLKAVDSFGQKQYRKFSVQH